MIKSRNCSFYYIGQNTEKTKEEKAVVFGDQQCDALRAPSGGQRKVSPGRGRKGIMARSCPVSLEAGSKINLTAGFQGVLKNGHNLQFEIPRNPMCHKILK